MLAPVQFIIVINPHQADVYQIKFIQPTPQTQPYLSLKHEHIDLEHSTFGRCDDTPMAHTLTDKNYISWHVNTDADIEKNNVLIHINTCMAKLSDADQAIELFNTFHNAKDTEENIHEEDYVNPNIPMPVVSKILHNIRNNTLC
jgi:hypothetical protein